MFEIRVMEDYVWMFVAAAALGTLGGIAFELLQTRGADTGTIEWPRKIEGDISYFDLGFFSSIIVGAVAAIVVLYFFPLKATETVANGTTTTTHTLELIRFVPLTLIAGFAGQAILTAAQAQILAIINKNDAETTKVVATAEIEKLKSEAAETAEAAVRDLTNRLLPLVSAEIREAADAVPPSMLTVAGTLEIPDERRMEALSSALRAQPATSERVQKIERQISLDANAVLDQSRADLKQRFEASQALISRVAQGLEARGRSKD